MVVIRWIVVALMSLTGGVKVPAGKTYSVVGSWEIAMKTKEVTSDFTFSADGKYVRRTTVLGPDRRGPDAIVAKRLKETPPAAFRERTTAIGSYSVKGKAFTFRVQSVTLTTPDTRRKDEVAKFNMYMKNAVKAMPEYTGTLKWTDGKNLILVINPEKGRHENPVTLEMKRKS